MASASSSAAAIPNPYALPRAPAEPEPRRGLFFADAVANYLAAIAAAVLVTLIIAFAVTRSTKKDAILALEDEITESYRKPLVVESGKIRAPAVIEDELDTLYGAARSRFLMIMFVGIPLGLAVGRIRS